MPRRKQTKKTARVKKASLLKEKRSESYRWTESYTSLLLGAVVVIIAILFVGSLLKLRHSQQVSSTHTMLPADKIQQNFGDLQQKSYVVQPGDDLWHIAVKFYNNGYNWIDIARANNITDPGMIYKGDKLIIPDVKNEQQIITNNNSVQNNREQNNGSTEAITTPTYTIEKGDNLWNIAVRAYADGYKWVDIARANNLDNPGLIFSGNILKIPR